MLAFMSRRFAAVCLGIAAAMTAQSTLAADFSDPPGPDMQEAGSPPDFSGERGPRRVYREERIDEEAPPPRADRMPFDPRYAAGPRFAPPPPPQEECRTIVRHRVNAFGEEIRRRIQICDERSFGGPVPRIRPSGYGRGPVPPADIPEGPDGDPRGY